MKKIISLIVFCWTSLFCLAQDTITQQTYNRYFYGWWRDTMPVIRESGEFRGQPTYEITNLANYFTYSSPSDQHNFIAEEIQLFANTDTLRIVGIATAATNANYFPCSIADTDHNLCYEQLKLYHHNGGNPQLIDQGSFNIFFDTAWMLKIGDHEIYGDWNVPIEEYIISRYLPIYEVMFDSVITITDSFYIGRTFNNMRWNDEQLHPGIITCYWFIQNGHEDWRWIPKIDTKARFHNDPPDEWYTFEADYYQVGDHDIWENAPDKYYLSWAILEEDSTNRYVPECPKISGLNGTPYMDSCLSLTWTGSYKHSRWEVSCSTDPDNPSSGRIIQRGTPFASICTADSGTYYIRVRGFCTADSNWSPWSDSIVFHVESLDVEGIQRPSVLDAVTRVQPNPASYFTTVTSSYEIKQIDLYSIHGQHISSTHPNAHSATVDVFNLTEGTYMMLIHTSKGIATKRLVVQ